MISVTHPPSLMNPTAATLAALGNLLIWIMLAADSPPYPTLLLLAFVELGLIASAMLQWAMSLRPGVDSRIEQLRSDQQYAVGAP